MVREPTQAPLRPAIEPLHGLRRRRDDRAICGADRRSKRTTSQLDIVTCPECRLAIESLDAATLSALTNLDPM